MEHDVVRATLAAVQWCSVRLGISILSVVVISKVFVHGASNKGLNTLGETLAHKGVYAGVQFLLALLLVAAITSTASDVYRNGYKGFHYGWWTSAPTEATEPMSDPTEATEPTSPPTAPTAVYKGGDVFAQAITTIIFSAATTARATFDTISQFIHGVEAMLMSN
jgi:hypothetical protein